MTGLNLGDSIQQVPGVGAAIATKLKRLEIATVEDLLWHLPSSYEDYSHQVKVLSAPVGELITLRGKFVSVKSRQSWKRRLQLTEAIFADDSGSLSIIWFGKFPRKNLPVEEDVFVWGTIEQREGKRQMINPQIKKASEGESPKLQAIYPLTAGLSQWNLRILVTTALKNINQEDWLAPAFLKKHKLADIKDAFSKVHLPVNHKEVVVGKRRLAFDELFFLNLSKEVVRARRLNLVAPKLAGNLSKINKFFPPLTFDQEQACQEIIKDLARPYPMARLLQGEVGSGKTIVAMIGAALTADSGYQTLVLAPTEILAKQHYNSFREHLSEAGYKIALLTRSQAELSDRPQISKAGAKEAIAQGLVQIVIGTQAILEETVKAPKIGLVVVDEQHRFGVVDRLTTQKKSNKLVPHLLSMTATPIPRSLQLIFRGELDVSTLKILPFGPRQIQTMLFKTKDRRRVEEAIRRRVAKGEKVYVVCPLIDPSDTLGVKSVTEEFTRLKQEAFTDVSMGILHGKMPATEKNQILDNFRSGQIKILVSTTVVEVGVDVSEATVMVIEAAERFGLAQLHQLRGRVGRRGRAGVCVLFTDNASATALQRLQAFAETNSGFALAELDLKLRGPGEWFGVKQAGYEEFKAADLADQSMVEETQTAAASLIKEDPTLKNHKSLYWRVEKKLLAEYHVS